MQTSSPQVEEPAKTSRSGHPASRLLELDGIRGLTAIAVLIYHYTTRYEEVNGHSRPLGFGFSFGQQGPAIFFIVSGFVIFMTLARTRQPQDFLVSRFARLFPAYWTAVALTFAVVSLFSLPGREVSLRDAAVNLSMLQEFFDVPDVDRVYWTLATELSFYGLVFVCFLRRWLAHISKISIGWLALSCLFVALNRGDAKYHSFLLKEYFIFEYSGFFITGILFYLGWRESSFPISRKLLILACLLPSIITGNEARMGAAALGILLFTLLVQSRLGLLRARSFVFLGQISYSLYLTHNNIGLIVIREMESRGLDPRLSVLLAASVAMVLATLITYLIERPAMSRIRHIHRRYRERSVPLPAASIADQPQPV
jgi:peptidoglycan/LPS O-acetylase OafA/YrhL